MEQDCLWNEITPSTTALSTADDAIRQKIATSPRSLFAAILAGSVSRDLVAAFFQELDDAVITDEMKRADDDEIVVGVIEQTF